MAFSADVDRIVHRRLDEARWRLIVQQFLHQGSWALVAGFSLLFIGRFLALFLPVFRSLPVGVWVAALALPLGVAAVAAFCCWREPGAVARAIDARAPTRDRFLTALRLDGQSSASMAGLVQREVAAFVSNFRVRDHLTLQNPGRKLLWLLVPLAGLGGIEGFRHWRGEQLAPERERARQIVEEALLAAGRQAEKDPALAEAARELEVALDRLPDSPEPLREALRALAELEQKLSASGDAALSADEASALAGALAGEQPQLASDLRSGNNQAAADGIAKLEPSELAKALEEAARHVEEKRLQELSNMGATQAQKRLVTMLQSSDGKAGGAAGRRFVSELSDIKSGLAGMAMDAQGAAEGDTGSAPDGAEKSAPAQTGDERPGGAPGSEKDFGRGSDLAGEADPEKTPQAVEEFIEGTAGEGSSLVEIFRAAGGDDAAAVRAYRSAYESALPAALDAVDKEEIPPGSRLLVRRYFEAIRPKE